MKGAWHGPDGKRGVEAASLVVWEKRFSHYDRLRLARICTDFRAGSRNRHGIVILAPKPLPLARPLCR